MVLGGYYELRRYIFRPDGKNRFFLWFVVEVSLICLEEMKSLKKVSKNVQHKFKVWKKNDFDFYVTYKK